MRNDVVAVVSVAFPLLPTMCWPAAEVVAACFLYNLQLATLNTSFKPIAGLNLWITDLNSGIRRNRVTTQLPTDL